MLEIADASLPASSVTLTVTEGTAAANRAAAYRVARLAALTAWAETILRTVYPDRPAGVTARAEVAARFEAELYDTYGAADAELYLAIDDLRGRVIDYLSQQITNLAPLITVTTARSLPALFMAWRLYADPLRAGELVARNSVRHPAFMPKSFLALSR
jgi:prophage DNA circulation protein